MGTESLANNVLISLKRQVAHEEGIGRRVARVAILLSTVVGAIPGCGIVARSSEVNVGDTIVNLGTLLGIEGSCGVGSVGKLDVSEALGAARLAVSHDTSASELTELLKLAVQPLVVDVPAQVTDEEVLDTITTGLNLGLLGRSSNLVVSLTLLRWLLNISAGLLVRAATGGAVIIRGGILLILAGGRRVRVFLLIGRLLFTDQLKSEENSGGNLRLPWQRP